MLTYNWSSNSVLATQFNFDTNSATFTQMDVQAMSTLIQQGKTTPSMNLNGDSVINQADVDLLGKILTFGSSSAADQASLLGQLTPDVAATVLSGVCTQGATALAGNLINSLTPAQAAAILDSSKLDVTTAQSILSQAENQKAAAVIVKMTTAKAADILETMNADVSAAILSNVTDTNKAAELLSNMKVQQATAAINSKNMSVETASGILKQVSPEMQNQILAGVTDGKVVSIMQLMGYAQNPTAGLASMADGLAAQLLMDNNTTVEQAATLLNNTPADKAASVVAAMTQMNGGTDRAASIVNAMDNAKAAGMLVEMYNDFKTQAASGEPLQGMPAYMTLISNYHLTATKGAAIFSQMTPQDASTILKSMGSTNSAFFASKASEIFKALPTAFKTQTQALLGDKIANRLQNYRVDGTKVTMGMFGNVSIWLTGDEALTTQNIAANNIDTVGVQITYTYADGTTMQDWKWITADDIDVFGHIDLDLPTDFVDGAVSIDLQAYSWDAGETVDEAHAETLGDLVTVNNPDLFGLIPHLPELDVVSGKPGQTMTFDFDGKVDINWMDAGGVWIEYTDTSKPGQFYTFEDFEYMIDPVSGKFEIDVPAGVKSLSFVGLRRLGDTTSSTFSSTVVFDASGNVVDTYTGRAQAATTTPSNPATETAATGTATGATTTTATTPGGATVTTTTDVDATTATTTTDISGAATVTTAGTTTNQNIPLNGKTLTPVKAYTVDASGNPTVGTEFNNNADKTIWAYAGNNQYEQIGYQAGANISLDNGKITLTASQAFYTNQSGANPELINQADKSIWTYTGDGNFKQIGLLAGAQMKLSDNSVVTANARVLFDETGHPQAGAEFTAADKSILVATADGYLTPKTASSSAAAAAGATTEVMPAATTTTAVTTTAATPVTAEQKSQIESVFGADATANLFGFQQVELAKTILAVGGVDSAKKIVGALNDTFTQPVVTTLLQNDVASVTSMMTAVKAQGVDAFKITAQALVENENFGTEMTKLKDASPAQFVAMTSAAKEVGGIEQFKSIYSGIVAKDSTFKSMIVSNPDGFSAMITAMPSIKTVFGSQAGALTLNQQTELATVIKALGGVDKAQKLVTELKSNQTFGTEMTALANDNVLGFATVVSAAAALGGTTQLAAAFTALSKDTCLGAAGAKDLLTKTPADFANAAVSVGVFGDAVKTMTAEERSQAAVSIVQAGGVTAANKIISAMNDTFTADAVKKFDLATTLKVMTGIAAIGIDDFKTTGAAIIKNATLGTEIKALMANNPAGYVALVEAANTVGTANFATVVTELAKDASLGAASLKSVLTEDPAAFATLITTAATVGIDRVNTALAEFKSANPYKTTLEFVQSFNNDPAPAGYTATQQQTLVDIFGTDVVKGLTLDEQSALSKTVQSVGATAFVDTFNKLLTDADLKTSMTAAAKTDILGFSEMVATATAMGFDAFKTTATKLLSDATVKASFGEALKKTPAEFGKAVKEVADIGFDTFKTNLNKMLSDSGTKTLINAAKDIVTAVRIVKEVAVAGFDAFKTAYTKLMADAGVKTSLSAGIKQDPLGAAQMITAVAALGYDTFKTMYAEITKDTSLGKTAVETVIAKNPAVFANLVVALKDGGGVTKLNQIIADVDKMFQGLRETDDYSANSTFKDLLAKDPAGYIDFVAEAMQIGTSLSSVLGGMCSVFNNGYMAYAGTLLEKNIATLTAHMKAAREVGGWDTYINAATAIHSWNYFDGNTSPDLIKAVAKFGSENFNAMVGALYNRGTQAAYYLAGDTAGLIKLMDVVSGMGIETFGKVLDALILNPAPTTFLSTAKKDETGFYDRGSVIGVMSQGVGVFADLIKTVAGMGTSAYRSLQYGLYSFFGEGKWTDGKELVDYLFYTNPSGYVNLLQTSGGMGLENFTRAVDTLDAQYGSYNLVGVSLLRNTSGLMDLAKAVNTMGADNFVAATDMLDTMFSDFATAQALLKDPAGTMAFIQTVNTLGADKAKELIQMANLYLGKNAIAGEFVNDPKAFNQMVNNAATMGKEKWEAALKEYAAAHPQTGADLPTFTDPQQAGTAQKPSSTGQSHGEVSYHVDPVSGKIYTSVHTLSDNIWVKDVNNTIQSAGDGITKDSHFTFTYNPDGSLAGATETKYSEATGRLYQASEYNPDGTLAQTLQYDETGTYVEFTTTYTKNPTTGNLDATVKDKDGEIVVQKVNFASSAPSAKEASYKEKAFNGQIGNPVVSSGNGKTTLIYPDGTTFEYDGQGNLISSGTFQAGTSSGGSSSNGGKNSAGRTVTRGPGGSYKETATIQRNGYTVPIQTGGGSSGAFGNDSTSSNLTSE
ncbi:MAG TPA: hypothetical protein P5110_00960 [Candidatus Omnitrophota bacterium]|nr:hypothetical protein [Candidatus Omnitrophota bacterium]